MQFTPQTPPKFHNLDNITFFVITFRKECKTTEKESKELFTFSHAKWVCVLSTFFTQKMKILQVIAFGGEKIETVKKSAC